MAGFMGEGRPSTLTEAETELDRLPLARPPKPEVVRVWAHFGDATIRIEAERVAWTPRACAVKWMTVAGAVHRAWVWASAVERSE